jgi:TATA-box binding protein (TBP) (component of TFIID and TFIIIB)
MVFGNGKISVNGNVKTPSEARRRVRRYVRLVQNKGWPVTLKTIKIVTMSAYYRTDDHLSVDALVRDMGATYEPVPAAMFKRRGIHFTCFRNGKILVTGIHDERAMEGVVMPTLIELELLSM